MLQVGITIWTQLLGRTHQDTPIVALAVATRRET